MKSTERNTCRISMIVSIVFCLITITLSLSFGGLIYYEKPVREALKKHLGALDASVFNGLIRRTYHKQSLPNLDNLIQYAKGGDYSWLPKDRVITVAHGLGPSLHGGMNSLLTMEYGLELGFQIFEVDLVLTADGYLICYHEEPQDDLDKITYAQYLEKMRQRNMVPLLFSDLVKVIRKTPQVRVILDVKNRFEETYQEMRKIIADPDLGKSFIPQLYFFEQLEEFRKKPFFAGEIYTSYRSALTTQQILDYARRLGIRAVALTLVRYDEINNYIPKDVYIMIHSVDDPFLANKMIKSGVRGIYTSYITPRTYPDLFKTK